jgi:hypothetical protein
MIRKREETTFIFFQTSIEFKVNQKNLHYQPHLLDEEKLRVLVFSCKSGKVCHTAIKGFLVRGTVWHTSGNSISCRDNTWN